MNANVGSIDKAIRVLVGLGLLSLFYFLDGNARYLGLIGLVPLLTAVMSFCPIYTLLGLSTCPTKK
ncbi:MAG: DUF2892 domain-containing protein [Holophaga sp.]|nr:DUF2892 domain-containing protein [Holophaga sp.]